MKRTVIVACLLVACTRSHEGQQELRQGECVNCHTAEYDATTAPVHATAGFPTTCVDCHRTIDWVPALEGIHPEPRFAVTAGAHGGLACLGCHDLDAMLPSAAGANTNCLQCHPDDAYQRDSHVGVKGPAGQTYAYTPAQRNFCLTCHPAGTALKHPRDRFPFTEKHTTSHCSTCHDRASGLPDQGGMNTNCLASGCHSLTEEDGEHREHDGYGTARGDGSNRHFCLQCHPTGRT